MVLLEAPSSSPRRPAPQAAPKLRCISTPSLSSHTWVLLARQRPRGVGDAMPAGRGLSGDRVTRIKPAGWRATELVAHRVRRTAHTRPTHAAGSTLERTSGYAAHDARGGPGGRGVVRPRRPGTGRRAARTVDAMHDRNRSVSSDGQSESHVARATSRRAPPARRTRIRGGSTPSLK